MSLIIAGRFDTFAEGETAAQALFASGFVEDDVTMFFVNPAGQHARTPIGGDHAHDASSRGSKTGASLGVVTGAVIGAMLGVAVFLLVQSPLLITVIVAVIGAYVGSLAGAMISTRSRKAGDRNTQGEETAIRESGVLLAVHVTPANQDDAARILREAGAREVERATGRWSQGRWSDFDPVSPPQLDDQIGLAGTQQQTGKPLESQHAVRT